MTEPRFEFRYDLSAQDVEVATRWSVTSGPRTREYTEERRRAGLSLLVLAAVCFGAGALLILLNLPARGPLSPAATFAVSAVAGAGLGLLVLYGLFFRPSASRRILENAIRRTIARESAQSMLGPCLARIDERGCYFDRPLGDGVRRWAGVLECIPTDAMIYFVTLDQSVYGVPARVFDDQAHQDRFLAAVRRWIDELGPAATGRVTAFLRNHDLPCPACRYNLRGVTVMTCPECGESLARAVLPEDQTPSPAPDAAGSTGPTPPTPPR